MSDYKLGPCPFCGGNGEIVTYITSGLPTMSAAICRCKKCGASTKVFKDHKGDGKFVFDAIYAWNGRVDE